MNVQDARIIIVDPYLNRKTAETVARSTGATVVDVAQFPGGVKVTEADVTFVAINESQEKVKIGR